MSLQPKKSPSSPPPSNALDRFFESWAASKNPVLIGFYLLGKTLWMVYMAVIAFILWLIAAAPG